MLPSSKAVLAHGMGLNSSEAEIEGRNLTPYQGVKSAPDFGLSKEVCCHQLSLGLYLSLRSLSVIAARVFITRQRSTL